MRSFYILLPISILLASLSGCMGIEPNSAIKTKMLENEITKEDLCKKANKLVYGKCSIYYSITEQEVDNLIAEKQKAKIEAKIEADKKEKAKIETKKKEKDNRIAKIKADRIAKVETEKKEKADRIAKVEAEEKEKANRMAKVEAEKKEKDKEAEKKEKDKEVETAKWNSRKGNTYPLKFGNDYECDTIVTILGKRLEPELSLGRRSMSLHFRTEMFGIYSESVIDYNFIESYNKYHLYRGYDMNGNLSRAKVLTTEGINNGNINFDFDGIKFYCE